MIELKNWIRLSIVLRVCAILAWSIALTNVGAADTLRVVAYNALNFRGAADSDRLDDFRIVMQAISPDIAAMQEIIYEDAVDHLLSFAFLPVNDDWAAAEFMNGPDTDNALFYRTSKARLISQRAIATTLRDINEYVLAPAAGDTTIRFRIYSAHLKASQGADNEERRRQECATLRQQLNLLPGGSLFMMVGDFNLYTSAEPAYQLLLSADTNPNGQLFDPINRPGEWHATVSFADIHTQSPRTTSFGGGATGGIDDRFDFILVSAAWMDTAGSYVLPATHRAFGNDGQHFNQAVNDGYNAAVPDSVADALHYASDHLPVVVDVVVRPEPAGVTEIAWQPERPELFTCYPNPFNGTVTMEIPPQHAPIDVAAFDVLGRRVLECRVISNGSTIHLPIDFGGMAGGTYLIRASTPAVSAVQRVVFIP
ncbi:hypothetical protein KKH27_03575 [bacterium]|nr:hypothetical protein [bacterium]MBU1984018.1 hypothetical protein [bacterium]